MVDLAKICQSALVVAPDSKKVERLFKAAAEQGNLEAISNLAVFYLDGQSGKREINKAINLLRMESKYSNSFSYFLVGYIERPGENFKRIHQETC
ncbi:MAG: sel1 repeat family protein [Rhizobiales bacterium]|nr:sel1 repeat family protein [Hyphomicrobiales bacterium]